MCLRMCLAPTCGLYFCVCAASPFRQYGHIFLVEGDSLAPLKPSFGAWHAAISVVEFPGVAFAMIDNVDPSREPLIEEILIGQDERGSVLKKIALVNKQSKNDPPFVSAGVEPTSDGRERSVRRQLQELVATD